MGPLISVSSILERLCFLGDKPNILATFMLGQIVTVSAGIISYPLDTVRRRLMMTSGSKEKLYNGTMDCFAKIYQNEGGKAFFKGCLSNVIRGTVVLSCLLSTTR